MPPIFFYLPLIITSGLIEVILHPTYDGDERDARDTDPTVEAGTVVDFPGHHRVPGAGGASAG